MNKELKSKGRFSQLMEEQAKSGLNKKAFCKKKGIKVATYYYWQKKLLDESEESPGFQQISLAQEEELSFFLVEECSSEERPWTVSFTSIIEILLNNT